MSVVALSFDNATFPSPTNAFSAVSGEAFRRAVVAAMTADPQYQSGLSLKESYQGHTCWLGPDTSYGCAIAPDLELVNVFSRVKGGGRRIMAFVTDKWPNLHLNCFDDPHIRRFYHAYGFREVRREPNWTPGGPDVLYLVRGKILVSVP